MGGRRVQRPSWRPLRWLVLAWCLGPGGIACVRPGGPTTPAPATSDLATAGFYDTQAPSGPAYLGPAAAAIETGVKQALANAGVALLPDPRLGSLAAWTGDFWAVHGRFPTTKALTYEANRVGLVEPVPSVGLMGTADDAGVAARVSEQLQVMLGRGAYTHVGAASVRSGSKLRIILMVSARPLSLEPVPAERPTGTELHLQGRVADGYRAPELLVIGPDGVSTRRGLGGGTDIDAEVLLPHRGAYQIELLAEGRHGLSVVANFPVYGGVRRPPPPDPLPMTHDVAETPEAMRATMLDLINTTRARAELPELAPDPALETIAAAHNRDMLANGFVGHTSPTTGKPEERVRAAGFHAPVIAENVGRGYSLAGIHEGLLGSPGHRDNLLHPKVTHVGIDILATEQDAKHEFLVTEVFIRVIPTLRSEDRLRLVGRVNRTRAQAGHRELAIDRQLQALAEQAASRHFERPELAPEDNLKELRNDRASVVLPYAGLSQTLSVVSALEDLEDLDILADPAARAIGIGLAQGARPGTVPNAIAAVILVGY